MGYDPEKNLVTIPYNPDCKGYVDRVLWDGNKYYKHDNYLFNVNALYEIGRNMWLSGCSDYVFITEGQIDAMSFIEIGLDAIGLGGVNEVSKLIMQLKEKSCNKILVLALDNDKAGRRATGKFIEKLAEAELDQRFIVNSDMYEKYKDANEFLVADREGFKEKMKRVLY